MVCVDMCLSFLSSAGLAPAAACRLLAGRFLGHLLRLGPCLLGGLLLLVRVVVDLSLVLGLILLLVGGLVTLLLGFVLGGLLVLVLVLGLFLVLGGLFVLVLGLFLVLGGLFVLVLGLGVVLGLFRVLGGLLVLVLGLGVVLGLFLVLGRLLVLVLLLGVALVALGLVLGARALVSRLVVLGLLLLRLLLLLLVRVFVGLDDLAVLDHATPALDLVGVQDGAGHHVAPEVTQLGAGAAALGAPDVAGLLEQALGVVLQDHQDPGEGRGHLVEGDRAVDVSLLALGPPHDLLVGLLLED